MKAAQIRKRAGRIRKIRKIHRIAGLYFFLFFLVISISGLLLAWKKNSGELISIPTFRGTTKNMETWLHLHELTEIATDYYQQEFPGKSSISLSRIDVRPENGILKFLFEDNYYEIQIDGATGEILHSGYRVSDIIENIHDGSVLDRLMKNREDWFKLIYSTLLGLASVTFAVTGYWMWRERKKIRKLGRR